jgi:hypothetical protein
VANSDEGIGGPLDVGARRVADELNLAERSVEPELALVRARVDRLERQLAVMVKRFSEGLNEHGRRLDRVDEPPERRWFDR